MDAPTWTTEQLRDRGWTHEGLRRASATGRLTRVRRGVYALPQPNMDPRAAHVELVKSTSGFVHPDAVVSHASAAALHRLPVNDAFLDRVHLTRPGGGGHGRDAGAIHLMKAPVCPDEIVEIDGIRVTSLARTVADLARVWTFAWGVIACDAALHRGLHRDALLEAIERTPRRWGTSRARACASFADGRAESPLESLSRVQFDRMGVPTPEPQFEVTNDGVFVARCDFGWRERGVVGECDGKVKYRELLKPGEEPEDVVMREKRRHEAVRHQGWWVFQWDWSAACDGPGLASRAYQAFRNASPRRSA